MRYEPPAINFHLRETSPREPEGRGRIAVQNVTYRPGRTSRLRDPGEGGRLHRDLGPLARNGRADAPIPTSPLRGVGAGSRATNSDINSNACRSLNAIGGTAEIDRPPAPIASDENDPEAALGQAKIPHCSEAMTVRHAMDFFDSIGL